MSVQYVEPFQRALRRTRTILFAPFELRTWLVLGFAAWLAGLLDGEGDFGWSFSGFDDDESVGRVGEEALGALEAIGIGLLLMVLLVAAFALFVLVLWVNSRGKLVFLDNVATGKARIREPWKRWGARGDSLFVWRFVFGIVVLLVLAALTVPVVLITGIGVQAGFDAMPVVGIALWIAAIAFVVVIPALYVDLFLDGFVVPIMVRHDLPATKAWGRFLPLLKARFGHFLLFGVVMFVLHAAVTTAIVMIGFATCCVGLVLFALPYVGTVLTLPVWVAFRAYTAEFLAQFDPELQVLEPLGESAPPPPPPPPAQLPRDAT